MERKEERSLAIEYVCSIRNWPTIFQPQREPNTIQNDA
jgi:hypothetical protein